MGHAKLHFREAGSKIQAIGNFIEPSIRVSSTKERWWEKGMVGRQMEGNLTDKKILKENSCVWTVYGS